MDMGAGSGGRRLPPGSALPLQPLCSSGPSFLVSRGGKAAETSSGLCSVQGRAACQAQTPPTPTIPSPPHAPVTRLLSLATLPRRRCPNA